MTGHALAVGLIAAPGEPADLAAEVAAALRQHLAKQHDGVRGEVEAVSDGLVDPPATLDELLDAARGRLLEDGWDLAICLTDLPLRLRRRPVIAHASTVHSVGLLSVPALGPVRVRERAVRIAIRLLDDLLGNPHHATHQRPGTAHDGTGTRRARARP